MTDRDLLALLVLALALALATLLGSSGDRAGGENATEGESAKEPRQAPTGARIKEGTRERVEPCAVHAKDLRNRLRTAVEARRQDGAQSPSSVVLLLRASYTHHDIIGMIPPSKARTP